MLPLQKKVFEAIIKIHGTKAKAIASYILFAHCSRSVAYERFDGKKAISGDHLLELLAKYQLHGFDIWPEGWDEKAFISTIPDIGVSQQNYRDQMLSDLRWLEQQSNGHLYQAVLKMPLFLMKSQRLLAAFAIFFHLKYFSKNPLYQHSRFDSEFANHTVVFQWLLRCRQVLTSYASVPGTELWSGNVFDHLIQQIMTATALDDIADATTYKKLLEDLQKLVDEIETMFLSGHKTIGGVTQPATVIIYNHKGLITQEVLLGTADEGFIYTELDSFRLVYSRNSNRVSHTKQYLESTLRLCAPITKNALACRNIVEQMRSSCNRLRPSL